MIGKFSIEFSILSSRYVSSLNHSCVHDIACRDELLICDISKRSRYAMLMLNNVTKPNLQTEQFNRISGELLIGCNRSTEYLNFIDPLSRLSYLQQRGKVT